MTPSDIADQIMKRNASIVVLTGGEPLLQQDRPGWWELLERLDGRRRVHIETNGTVVPNQITLAVAQVICVSPKLPNAGQHRGHQDPAPRSEFIDLTHSHSGLHLKVVCRNEADVVEAVGMANALRWPMERVWVMPEGTNAAILADRWPVIASAAARLGINACHRLHLLAWGDERGF